MRSVGAVALATLTACDLYFGESAPAALPDAPAAPRLFAAPVTYAADSPVAIAVGDVNGDSKPDLIVTGGSNSGSVGVLLNEGGGSFGSALTTPAGSYPVGVTAGDFDGNGTVEAAVADGAGKAVVLGDMGAGGFAAQATFDVLGGPMAIATGDFNHDGILDLALATYFADVSVLLGTGSGGFGPRTEYGSQELDAIAVGDMNQDGALDLVTATSGAYGQPGPLNVLLGHGDGTFAAPASFEVGDDPESVALGDLDGDGVLDAVTANFSATAGVSVVFGLGNGAFGPQTTYPANQPGQVALADIDGDGKLDLVVGTDEGSFTLRLNAGDGTFPTAQSYPCGACGRIAIADVDGDGKPDVIGVAVSISELGVFAGGGPGISVMLHEP